MTPDDVIERQELMYKVMEVFALYTQDDEMDAASELSLYLDTLGNCIGFLVHQAVQEQHRDMAIDALAAEIKKSMMMHDGKFKVS